MRLSTLVLATAALLAASAAHAQEDAPVAPAAEDAGEHRGWSAGIGAAWSPSAYRSYDNRAWPVPTFAYEGERFFVRGPGLGLRLLDVEGFELDAVATLYAQRYRAKDARDAQMRQLDDRSLSGVAGLDARWKGQWGLVSASVKKEFTGHGGGIVGDLNYSYPIPTGRLTWIPTLGVEYASADMNDYYYGIDAREAARSGLAQYRPGSSLAPYLSIAARMQINERWSATAGVRSLRLADDVKDSPMVDGSMATGYVVSVNYRF